MIIVGAGLAGLSRARRLLAENRDVILLEASERIGGRVKTDVVEGFLALPDQPVPAPNPTAAVGELRPGIFVCGEYGSLPSIQRALLSGRLAAEAVSVALAH